MAISALRAKMGELAKKAPTLIARQKGSFQHSSKELMQMEADFAAKNYSPLPVVFSKAEGMRVWDPEGKQYYDFLSAYSAVNQGHNHPRIIAAMKDQLDKLCLSSRAYYNDIFPKYAKFVTELTGYDRFLPANSGAEANEAAIKMARKWGYRVKGIPKDEAIIVVCSENFHGRTTTIVGFSTDPDAYDDYGPFTPGFEIINFDDIPAFEKVLKEKGDKICAFLIEPIQGEAGVIMPAEDYLAKAHALCKKHNVLLISDEVQTGFGRTGKLFCSDYAEIKPDVIVVGKALSGGLYPVSGVLADKEVMDVFTPGTHGSTFGGSPIAAAVGIESIAVLIEEDMINNSYNMGKLWREKLTAWGEDKNIIVRGKGLLNAIEVDPKLAHGKFAYKWCIKMAKNGLLAKPTHGNIIRFSPPLIITEKELDECVAIIKKSYEEAIKEL